MPLGGPPGTLIVFGKAPRPGLVKTRLCPPLTPEQAADFYAQLLDDVLETSGRFAAAAGLDAALTLHPAEACAALAGRVPANFRVIAQSGTGLAERMAWAVDEAIASGARRVLIRGSDNPALPYRDMAAALDALATHDVVVSPDPDGGYGLVGLRGPWSGIFDHPMSTSTVLEETVANARQLSLDVQLLGPSFDIDSVEDVARLRAAHDAGQLEGCDRSIAWLRAHGLWEPSVG